MACVMLFTHFETEKMIKFFAFFNPLTIMLLANFFVVIFYNFYSLTLIGQLIPLVPLAILVTIFLNASISPIARDLEKGSHALCLKNRIWQLFGIFIVLVGFLELGYFGIPLLGQVLYVEFGFPFLHHIAVSSWLLVFVKSRSNFLNKFIYFYALVFPLLIFNRDVFILTILCVLFRSLIMNKLRWIHLTSVLLTVITIFWLVGESRSGSVQQIIDLPISYDISSAIGPVFWLLIYLTSPSFNIHYNLTFDFSRKLYEPLLTVFPEYYKLYEVSPEVGLYLYLLIGMFAIFLPGLIRFPGWMCFSFFFYYQFAMGCIFGNKLLNTHSLFVLSMITIVYLCRQVFIIHNTSRR